METPKIETPEMEMGYPSTKEVLQVCFCAVVMSHRAGLFNRYNWLSSLTHAGCALRMGSYWRQTRDCGKGPWEGYNYFKKPIQLYKKFVLIQKLALSIYHQKSTKMLSMYFIAKDFGGITWNFTQLLTPTSYLKSKL